jgi:mRNA interferase RelE/StbE
MAETKYELEWTELSKKDYDSLDGSEKVVVDKGLTRIRLFGMAAGEPLSGNLSSCRKIKHRKRGLRIVFRRSKTGVEIIEIVAIGKRENFDVYISSKKRL